MEKNYNINIKGDNYAKNSINYNENNKKQNSNSKKIRNFLLILLAICLSIFITYYYMKKNPKIITKNRTISQNKVVEEAMEDAISKIYDSVLCIEIIDSNGNTISTGTGFVYDKEGFVLTNAHVVSEGYDIKGTLSNNKVISLKLMGTDTYTDLAVLKMDPKDILQVASIGTSKNTKIGNTVFTVGSPMGLSYAGTVTKGILSGKDRLIETTNSYNNESFIVKVLQTDAAISPGNSGGPLVNLAGDVIGINSLKLVDEQVEGMGFAIPIEDAMNYVNYLEKKEEIKRPIMGVQILDMTNKYILYRYNVEVPKSVDSGIILMELSEGYPAEKSGLKKNDIITKINDVKVSTVAEFKYELYKYSVGSTIKVTYVRNDKENTVEVKLNKEK